jgi:ABC-type nitrate/sulfonate/bicarbonate transport system substrate-binding protein
MRNEGQGANPISAAGLSRRQMLKLGASAGLLAGAMLVAPGARAQSGAVKLIHSSSAVLPLFSVTYLAEDMGFYQKEGLTVERLAMNSGPAGLAALLGREGPTLFSGPGESLAAIANGQSIKFMMSLANYNVLTLIAGKEFAAAHNITSDSPVEQRKAALAGAKGIRLGITVPGSLSDLATRMAVRAAGGDPDKDAQIVPLQTIANVFAAIANRGVDAAVGPSPAIEQTTGQLGSIELLKVYEMPEMLTLQGQAQMAFGDEVDKNRDLFAALIRAQLRAMQAIVEDPKEAGAVLAKARFANLTPEVWERVWANNASSFGSPFVTEERLRAWLATGLVGANLKPDSFDFAKIIDMSLVNEGLAATGWKPAG